MVQHHARRPRQSKQSEMLPACSLSLGPLNAETKFEVAFRQKMTPDAAFMGRTAYV